MVLIEVLILVQTTIEGGDNIHVRFSHLLIWGVVYTSILLVPPRIQLLVYHDYTIISFWINPSIKWYWLCS